MPVFPRFYRTQRDAIIFTRLLRQSYRSPAVESDLQISNRKQEKKFIRIVRLQSN